VNGTTKTGLLAVSVVVWGVTHIFALVQHFQVSSAFDTVFTTLVGAIMVSGKKDKKTPKD
jgi:hypothetical protein